MVKDEMAMIQRMVMMLIGDFIGYVGNEARGVQGNNPDVNSNGHKLCSFVTENNLIMINANQALCSGVFSRSTSASVSLLDYALLDANAFLQVKCMIIGELNVMLSHSDHSPVMIELNVGKTELVMTEIPKQRVYSLNSKTAGMFQKNIDQILEQGLGRIIQQWKSAVCSNWR